MKEGIARADCASWLVAGLLAFTSLPLSAQVNSWTAGSGNWDTAANWSLGVLPSSAQSVMITNSTWKAVAINSTTPVNYPNSMAVRNLTLLGAWDTFNTLLMNYVSAGKPLVIGVDSNTPGSLIIGTNSAVVMYSSGLIVNNALGTTNSHIGEFQVDGNFTQTANSEVVANFLDLTGSYDFTNSMLFVGTQFINGTFIQQGGVNTGAVDLQTTNSDYELFDGVVQGTVSLSQGTFRQWAGTNSVSSQSLGMGGYFQNGGSVFAGGINVIGTSGSLLSPPSPGMTEFAGTTTVTNDLLVEGGGNRHAPVMATFNMYGGSLSANRILLEDAGNFTQTNGTVNVANELYITDNGNLESVYQLSGGTLTASNATIISSYPNNSSIAQTGGTASIPGTLSVFGMGMYELFGGAVMAPHIVLSGNISSPAQFFVNGAQNFAVGNSGTISMNGGAIVMENSQQDFGSLTIGGDSGINFAGSIAIVRFNDSHTNTWAAAQLLVYNWNGSTNGGGVDQLVFGSSSSALTSGQLAEIVFVNPTGWPAGNYPARILSTGEVVPVQNFSPGIVNSWISGSGNWDDATSWSLGIIPDHTQAVLITNTGWKAVAINPSTPVNYPASMTVSTLTVRGSTNTENTLLLNYFGTTLPLTISNGLTLQDDGRILDFNSGLVVASGTVIVTNSQMIQDGGFVRVTNAPMYLQNSIYQMTNGVFEGGSVSIGLPVSAQFNQYGGTVTIGSLGVNSLGGTNQNGYSLYGGMLNLPGGMSLIGGPAGFSYLQTGGTNSTPSISVQAGYGGTSPTMTLNGGLLADGGLSIIGASPYSFTQNGGTHVVTNSVYLGGEALHPDEVLPAVYNLNNGTLTANLLELNANNGDSVFAQSNGTAHAETVYAHSVGYYSLFNTYLTLAGGALSCSNFTVIDGGDRFNQSGGALIVSNLLSFGGSRDVGGPGYPLLYGIYSFTGGSVTASNIAIGATMIIGDGAAPRISNSGTFSLSHLLQISNAVEQLGRFILASNAMIDLAGSASKLSFANSSAQSWASGAMLTISNWNGNISGGGAEQLKFGNSQSGLTPAQLNQMHFQIGTNSYTAKILSTGEVVPDQLAQPNINMMVQGRNMILNWPAGWTLQTATNVLGPYSDLLTATSPYTNDMRLDPQRYFRLRQ